MEEQGRQQDRKTRSGDNVRRISTPGLAPSATSDPMFQCNASAPARMRTPAPSSPARRQFAREQYSSTLKIATPAQCPPVFTKYRFMDAEPIWHFRLTIADWDAFVMTTFRGLINKLVWHLLRQEMKPE